MNYCCIFSAFIVAFSTLAAETAPTVYFRENFEGINPMRFRTCGTPARYFLSQAEKEGFVKVNRAGLTRQAEAKSHGDVQAFALDVILDKLTGRWGATAGWAHNKPLEIPLDKPVWMTAYVYPEKLPPELFIRMAVIFNFEQNGKTLRGGCLTFDARGVDPEGWMVFQQDLTQLVKRFKNPVMTGWQLTIASAHNQPFKGQNVVLYLDDVSLSSAPEKINVVTGKSAKITDIVPGPHTVGYTSLYRDYPEHAKNRIWNSSFENGFDRFYRSAYQTEKDSRVLLPDAGKTFFIRHSKDAPHGNAYLEIVRQAGVPLNARISTIPVKLEDGKDYTLSFYAKSSKQGDVLKVEGRNVRLTTEWKRYSLAFPKIKPQKRWGGRISHGRRWFQFSNYGDSIIALDAIQLEKGPLSAYEYPDMVSVSLRPVNRFGLALPGEKAEYELTLFNGTGKPQNVNLTRTVKDFAHRNISAETQKVPLAAGEGKTLRYLLPGNYRHYKIFVHAKVAGKKTQNEVCALSRIDDLSKMPGREFFGQLGAAGPNPDSDFAISLEINRLLGAYWMLVYNNLRFNFSNFSNWRTDKISWDRRNFLIDKIRESGFVPELAIYPFFSNVKRDAKGVEIIGKKELAEIEACCKAIAERHKHNLFHYEIFGEYMMGELPPRAKNVAKILPVVYRALKAGNPKCKVTAFAENNMPDICRELDAHFRLGTLKYCDQVSIHPYWIAEQDQEGLDQAIGDLRKLIDRYAPGKPFAGGEAGHRAVDTLHYDDIESESMYYPLHCTELEQAERVVREHLICMGRGFSRYIAFYPYTGSNFFSFSYVEKTGEIRPKTVFPAYNFMVKQLAGAKLVKIISQPENRYRCYLFTKGTDTFAVLWHYAPDHSARMISLDLPPQAVQGFNLVGEPISFSGKKLQFGLDGKPVYLHAGSISRTAFFKAVENLKMDHLSVAVAPKDSKNFTVSLQNGMTPRKGTLTVQGKTAKKIELKAGEHKILLLPVHAGKTEIKWQDGKEDSVWKICFFPIGEDSPELKLGPESRGSGFKEFSYGGENDLSATLHGTYDRENLYLEIKVRDDIFSAPYSSRNKPHMIWANDALQLGFDNTDFPEYKELNVSLTEAGPEMFATLGTINVGKIKFSGTNKPPFHFYSLTIPWRALWPDFSISSKPKIRFNIAVIDNDGKQSAKPDFFVGNKQYLQLTPGIVSGKNSVDFSWILFGTPEKKK